MFQHPPPLNDVSPLPPTRYVAGAGAITMLLICVVPVPMAPSVLEPAMNAHMVQGDINVPPDGWANATVAFNNTGNTRFDLYLALQEDHNWNVTFEDKVKHDKSMAKDYLDLRKDRSTNFTTRLNITLRPPSGAELGDRETFTIEMQYKDGANNWLHTYTKFTATVGWFTLKGVPQGQHVAVDTVVGLPITIKNRIHGEDAAPTVLGMHLALPAGIEGVLTSGEVANLTPQDIGTVTPIGGTALQDNETATVKIWLYAPPGTPVQEDLLANLTVSPVGMDVTTSILVHFDVVNPIYDVAIVPLYDNVTFQQGAQKSVAFQLVSRSTVDVTVRLTYSVDAANFTIVNSEVELNLPPGYDQTKSMTIDPTGDVGSRSELVIEIVYGPGWNRRASATIDLLITLSG
jgi:hypothetical protein